jgi:hypothetical protein
MGVSQAKYNTALTKIFSLERENENLRSELESLYKDGCATKSKVIDQVLEMCAEHVHKWGDTADEMAPSELCNLIEGQLHGFFERGDSEMKRALLEIAAIAVRALEALEEV